MTPITPQELMPDDFGEFEPLTAAPAQRSESGRNEKRQVVFNAATNAGVMVVKVLVVFLGSPILVHGLGDTRYGVWMFVSSITAYLALGDLGVKSAVMRFVARYDGLRDDDGINRVVNTSSAVLACVGVIVLVITFLMAYFWRCPSSIPAQLSEETRWFFVLSGILVAVLLPVSVPHALLAGLGRFPMRNSLSVISLLLRYAALVAVVWYGGDLFAVGVVLVASCILDYGMLCWAARHCFPRLVYSSHYVDRAMLRTLCGYGVHVFAGDIAFLVIGQSAPLIIGIYAVSADCNTYYSLGATLKDNALSILAMVVLVLVPAVSKWQAAGNDSAIRTLFIHATRYALFFVAPIESGLLVLGYPFLTLWMGRKYADVGYTTLVVLSVPLIFAAVGMVASRVLLGIGRVRPLALISILQAVLTVAFSVTLARLFGVEGVAWGVSLALALAAPATTILACRSLRVTTAVLLRKASLGPLLASALASLLWELALQWATIDNWATFFGIGILGMAPYLIVVMILEPDVARATRSATQKVAGILSSGLRASAGWLGAGRR